MTCEQNFLCLSEAQLEQLDITPEEAVKSIEDLFHTASQGQAWSAPKAVIQPPDGRYMMAALAAADNPGILAVKTLVLNPLNPQKGLPQINGLVTLLDSVTGLPLALISANWITAIRTAALSAAAAKCMANPDAQIAAFVGCGVQARSHLKAFVTMFNLKKIHVFGRGQANIDALCALAREFGLKTDVFYSGQEAVKEADVIVSSITYTPNVEPFLDARGLKPGVFAAITDLGAPWYPEGLAGFDRIAIDDLQQEAAMSAKLVPPELVTGDLSGLVMKKIIGRENFRERTAFIFRAHAFGDLALSCLAYQRAMERSIGTRVEF